MINKDRKALTVLICSLMLLLGICLTGCSRTPNYIASPATVEAGVAFKAENFITGEGHTAEFNASFADKYVTDGYAKINHTGKVKVGIIVDGKDYVVNLTVKDTVAPVAVAKDVTVCEGSEILPQDCLSGVEDATDVKYSFKSKPDTSKTGSISTVVVVTDEAGNKTEVAVNIQIVGINEYLDKGCSIEAGKDIPAVTKLFSFAKNGKYITDTSVINTDLIGTYTITIELDGKQYDTTLSIVDTVAPVANITPQNACLGSSFPEASSFVSNIIDAGPVKISYEVDPGTVSEENKNVRIVITDQAGNKTVYDSFCNIVEDSVAPVFLSAPASLDVDSGSSIVWRALVTAEDNSGSVNIELDTSTVDMKTPGTYTAQFVATDAAGNKTTKEVQIVVHDSSVTLAMMDEACNKVIKKVIKEGMTKQEMVTAVAMYIHDNIKYASTGIRDDLRKDAYLGLTTRKTGDCYTFYAASVEILNRLGIETMMVCRRPEAVEKVNSHHVWAYVNIGDSENPKWYHCDCSKKAKAFDQPTYLMTTAQAFAYTNFRAAESDPPKECYFTFDPTLYPESATEMIINMGIDAKYFE